MRGRGDVGRGEGKEEEKKERGEEIRRGGEEGR